MILKAFTTRDEFKIKNSNGSFKENLQEMSIEGEEYTFTAGFTLHDRKNRKIIADVSGIFFDEDKIKYEYGSIVEIADMIDSDVYESVKALYKSKIYNQEIDEEKYFLPLFSCYIQRIYVYPEYRNKGIARFIFKNLDQLFLYLFNTNIHCLFIIPKPQEPIKREKYKEWKNTPDEDGMILKRMIKLLKMEGYKQIGRTNIYCKNYASYENCN